MENMKISKSSDEEIILLSSKLLDGVISPLEHSRLSKLLKESPHNRASYLEIVRMESQLYWESGVSDVEVHQSKTNEKIIPFAIPLWISSVAAIFLAIFAVWQTSDKSDQDSSNIVNFTDPSIEGVGITNASTKNILIKAAANTAKTIDSVHSLRPDFL